MKSVTRVPGAPLPSRQRLNGVAAEHLSPGYDARRAGSVESTPSPPRVRSVLRVVVISTARLPRKPTQTRA